MRYPLSGLGSTALHLDAISQNPKIFAAGATSGPEKKNILLWVVSRAVEGFHA